MLCIFMWDDCRKRELLSRKPSRNNLSEELLVLGRLISFWMARLRASEMMKTSCVVSARFRFLTRQGGKVGGMRCGKGASRFGHSTHFLHILSCSRRFGFRLFAQSNPSPRPVWRWSHIKETNGRRRGLVSGWLASLPAQVSISLWETC